MRPKFVRLATQPLSTVAERWKRQYYETADMIWKRYQCSIGSSSKEIYDKLVALGDNPTWQDINAIIGNLSWTHVSCDGCSEYVLVAVSIGEYDSKNKYCPTCVAEAAALLAQHKDGEQ